MSTTTAEHQFELSRAPFAPGRLLPAALAVGGVVTLGVAVACSLASANGAARLSHAYLLAVTFFLSIALGALFFVVLQHLVGARWSIVTRRLAELLTQMMPALAVLMLPIIVPLFFGNGALYTWNSPELRNSDGLIQAKAAYLNPPFFAIRAAVYFAVWIGLSRFFVRQSIRQDITHDAAATDRLRRASGPAMLAFAITTNFAAFDWLMSLDPHWFSTIFGIYFFAGCAVAFFATLPLMAAIVQRLNYATQEITVEHYHEMGKLLFGFIMFWAYIAFSQYLLIWYANIPEETRWFLIRQTGSWRMVSLLLIIGHFLLPFFGLMSRSSRRDLRSLLFWSAFLLVMHAVDLFWLVMPGVSTQGLPLGLIELFCLAGVGAVCAAATLHKAAGIRFVPVGERNLNQSIHFHNA